MALESITSWEDVPLFDGEQAEAAYWLEHQVDLRLMEAAATTQARAKGRWDPRRKRTMRERRAGWERGGEPGTGLEGVEPAELKFPVTGA